MALGKRKKQGEGISIFPLRDIDLLRDSPLLIPMKSPSFSVSLGKWIIKGVFPGVIEHVIHVENTSCRSLRR